MFELICKAEKKNCPSFAAFARILRGSEQRYHARRKDAFSVQIGRQSAGFIRR